MPIELANHCPQSCYGKFTNIAIVIPRSPKDIEGSHEQIVWDRPGLDATHQLFGSIVVSILVRVDPSIESHRMNGAKLPPTFEAQGH